MRSKYVDHAESMKQTRGDAKLALGKIVDERTKNVPASDEIGLYSPTQMIFFFNPFEVRSISNFVRMVYLMQYADDWKHSR